MGVEAGGRDQNIAERLIAYRLWERPPDGWSAARVKTAGTMPPPAPRPAHTCGLPASSRRGRMQRADQRRADSSRPVESRRRPSLYTSATSATPASAGEAAQGELGIAGERMPGFQSQVITGGMDVGGGGFQDGRHAAAWRAAACRPSLKRPRPISIPRFTTCL